VLTKKAKLLGTNYGSADPDDTSEEPVLKWSETLRRRKRAGYKEAFDATLLRRVAYRPFATLWHYQSKLFVDRPASTDDIFPAGADNIAICFTDPSAQKPWLALGVRDLPDLHFVGAAAGTVCIGRYRFIDGAAVDNITDWALNRFAEHYEKGKGRRNRPITKDAIFHYIYGLLHDPVYREIYAQNLKREFPRISFYPDFWKWEEWGRLLMDLHLNYEQAVPYRLERDEVADEKARRAGVAAKPVLRSDSAAGVIQIDSETTLRGIPQSAWQYMLGSRSGLDWVLDQHKEKAPRDPTIAKHFDTYRFADHKEEMITLLRRVTTVSVGTMQIVDAMKALPRVAATSENGDE
jgi:predicted helicase